MRISQNCCNFAPGMVRKCCIFCWVLCCLACSPRALQDAQRTVAQADSLRLARCAYNDSLSLAQAYETLGQWKWLYADVYAHACYHYGRLLREKENPVEAMQVFINATHSHTRDFHILGRVYSNMGDICHLANEFDLSYDMFEHSADCFLRNRDSIAYYYALNDMAFELAEQADSSSCLSLLKQFEHQPEYMIALTMTKAELYLKCHEYDSAIYYAHQLCLLDNNNVIGLLIKAQCFSFLHIQDSAAYYAKTVLNISYSLSDKQNALYILTNDDNTKNIKEVRKAAADRSDVQQVLKIRQGRMLQAVQLLEQDINREPDLSWLYTLLSTICIIGGALFVYIHKKQRAHQLLSQKIQILKRENATNLAQKRKQVEEKCTLFTNSPTIKVDLHWNNYAALCKCIDMHFFMLAEKLKQKHIFNEQEVRLCVLVLLNMSRNQIADILPYAQNGVGKLKYRVTKKLHIEGKNLRKYLICTAIDEPYQ